MTMTVTVSLFRPETPAELIRVACPGTVAEKTAVTHRTSIPEGVHSRKDSDICTNNTKKTRHLSIFQLKIEPIFIFL